MHIHTIEAEFEYRMKKILRDFLSLHCELKELNSEDLADTIWGDSYIKDFGRMVIDDMVNYSGEEIFSVE